MSIVIWKEDDGSFNTPGILVALLHRIDMISTGGLIARDDYTSV